MKNFLSENWHKIPQPVRQIFVFIVGWLVVLAGIAMLALPGPGWAAIFLGFAILATEFTAARTIRDWMIAKLKSIIEWFKKRFVKNK